MTKEEAFKRVEGYLFNCLPMESYDEIKELISALNQDSRWIPVSEGLPERRKRVIVTYETEDGKKVAISSFDRHGCLIGDAIAWMPAPDAYREETTDGSSN